MDTFHANGAPADWQPLQETPEIPPERFAHNCHRQNGHDVAPETLRRDSNAVWHSWKWMQGILVVLGVWIGTVGIVPGSTRIATRSSHGARRWSTMPRGCTFSLGVPKASPSWPEDGQ